MFRGARRMGNDVVEVAHDRGAPASRNRQCRSRARTQRANVGAGRYPVDGLGGRVRSIRSVPLQSSALWLRLIHALTVLVRILREDDDLHRHRFADGESGSAARQIHQHGPDRRRRRSDVGGAGSQCVPASLSLLSTRDRHRSWPYRRVQAVSIPAAPAAPSSGVVAPLPGRWRPPVEPTMPATGLECGCRRIRLPTQPCGAVAQLQLRGPSCDLLGFGQIQAAVAQGGQQFRKVGADCRGQVHAPRRGSCRPVQRTPDLCGRRFDQHAGVVEELW